MKLEKYLDKPFFLPCMAILVSLFNSILHINSRVEEVWWYTIVPGVFGMMGLLLTMRKENEK
jgi:hypothetical protein